ncbi:GNAT family acetyltransferase [Aequorivita sediminis]|uniref:GNAT family acetyltransferase n=1 Tax=Aequorivita sediminis TaxID=3073653 RepID=UPI0028AD5C26|nr:GNAT family acetyltransferase [Aequorivita sp. F6058]
MINTRLAYKHDIEGVLLLQEKYLYRNLSEEERKQGFVTTPFSTSQLEEIISLKGLFVAENETNEVVAYAFAGSWKYFEQWNIFKLMIARLPQLSFNGSKMTTENTFQYGPICIDKKHRRTGLLNQLFEEMRIEFYKKYPIAITFINKVNIISIKAHTKKLGWVIIDEFEFNNSTYISLAFDMKRSVLLQ